MALQFANSDLNTSRPPPRIKTIQRTTPRSNDRRRLFGREQRRVTARDAWWLTTSLATKHLKSAKI
jgi:hypothetical protein